MDVAIPPEFEVYARAQVEAGAYASEAVAAALREHLARAEELRAEVGKGLASLDRGEGVDGETAMRAHRRRAPPSREMSRYTLSPEAIEDLRGVGDWIARDSPRATEDFLAAIANRLRRLVASPLTGRPREELGTGLRSIPHGRCIVFYRGTASGIAVARVMHGRRDVASARFPP